MSTEQTDPFLQYADNLAKKSFAGWSNDAVNGYTTALISLTAFYKKNIQPENKELKDQSAIQAATIQRQVDVAINLKEQRDELLKAFRLVWERKNLDNFTLKEENEMLNINSKYSGKQD